MGHPRPLLLTFVASGTTAVVGMLAFPFVAVFAGGSAAPTVACGCLVGPAFLVMAETVRQASRRCDRAGAGLQGYGRWDADDRWAAFVGAALACAAACVATMALSPSARDAASAALCGALLAMAAGLVRFQVVGLGIPGRVRRLASRLRRRPPQAD